MIYHVIYAYNLIYANNIYQKKFAQVTCEGQPSLGCVCINNIYIINYIYVYNKLYIYIINFRAGDVRGAAVAGLRVQAGGDRGPGADQAVAGGQESVHPGPQGFYIIVIYIIYSLLLYIYHPVDQAVAGGQESVHPGPQGCNVYNYHTYNVGMFIIIIDVIIYVLYIYNLGDGHSLGLLR